MLSWTWWTIHVETYNGECYRKVEQQSKVCHKDRAIYSFNHNQQRRIWPCQQWQNHWWYEKTTGQELWKKKIMKQVGKPWNDLSKLTKAVIIIMKNFNRRRFHGHHGSKCCKLVQHAHSCGSHTFTHTLSSTQLQPHCAKRQLSYYIIWNQIFILKVPEGGEENRSTQRKPPTACPLIGITY